MSQPQSLPWMSILLVNRRIAAARLTLFRTLRLLVEGKG